MTDRDLDQQSVADLESWEKAAAGWGKSADRIRDWSFPVSAAMIEVLALAPGQRVLELAAGPGDTGFMAAERITPGGMLICSDGAEAMLQVARGRASAQQVTNVEFTQLELERIDLPAGGFDAVLCRWGIMLVADPDAAAREIRRVLRPSGRAALAVWDSAERNPWVEIPSAVMRELGHMPPVPEPEPGTPPQPGMFRLSAGDGLADLLHAAGFTEVVVTTVAMAQRYDSVDGYLDEMIRNGTALTQAFGGVDAAGQQTVRDTLVARTAPYTAADGSLAVPGSSLVATAVA